MRKVLLSDQVCQELKLAYTTSAKGTQALTTCNQEEQQVSTLVTQRLIVVVVVDCVVGCGRGRGRG